MNVDQNSSPPVAPEGTGTGFPLTTRDVDGLTQVVFDRGPHTLVEVLRQAREHGERPALRFAGEELSYTQVWAAASAVAAALRDDYGVRPGDRVAIAMRNYPEWVLAFWGIQLAGAVAVGFNAWFGREELAYLVRDSAPSVIFADDQRLAALGDTGTIPIIVVRSDAPRRGVATFESLLMRAVDLERFAAHEVDPDSPATVLYTSGTTSTPKGVVATHRNHTTNLLQLALRSSAGATTQAAPAPGLVVYPLFHVAGLTLAYTAAFQGACAILLYKWDAREAMALIRQYGVRSFSGPPLTVRDLLDLLEEPGAPNPLVSVGSGGSVAPVSQVRAIGELPGVIPVTGYGLTETTATVTTISGEDFVDRPTSIGRPLPTVSIRVVDPAGDDVAAGDAGELLVRGAQVARGYLNRPDETAQAFADGWFHTGDLVRADEQGFLYLVGRLKDVVIRGGENISAGEVESVLSAHSAIAECAVIGVPHPRLGEEVCAVIRVRGGHHVSSQQLTAFAAEHLAAFKVPAHYVWCDTALPRNAAGKIVKSELRKLVVET